MKQKDFNEGLNHIDSDLVEEFIAKSEKIEKRNQTRGILIRVGALAACLCLIVGAVLIPLLNREGTVPQPDILDIDGIPITNLHVPSNAPKYYGSGNLSSISGGGSGYILPSTIAVTARLKEVLPDTYIAFDDWRQTEFRLLRMETVKLVSGTEMTEEFLYIVPIDYMTDFSVYDLFLIGMGQLTYEYAVLYNTTKSSLEQFDTVIFGYDGFGNYNFLGLGFMAFDENGRLDMNLWRSTESWIKSTQYDWKNYGSDYTLSQAEEAYVNGWSNASVHLLKDIPEDAKDALEGIKSFENGIFIPTLTAKLDLSPEVQFRAIRYINGFASNEGFYIGFYGNPDKFSYSQMHFTEEDLLVLPDLTSAREAMINAFEQGKINPPHIQNYEDMTLESHHIFCQYTKTDEGILGLIRVNWRYKCYYTTEKGGRYYKTYYDDAYYILEYGSNVCTPIDRDTLLEKVGEYDAGFIFEGDYDDYGKVFLYE